MNRTNLPGRRGVLAAGVALLAAPLAVLAQRAGGVPLEVWKDPNCGCCKDWVAHLEANGFQVKVNDGGNNAARSRLGVAPKYGSCHTAQVAGYAIEGHVPAREIHRLLRDRPDAIGLAVPGMPVGSPGMDGEVYGGRRDAYDVVLLARDGSARVYQHYEGHPTAKVEPAAGASGGAAELAQGEVRKIDRANGKVTLKHGPIRSLDMPGMTMVFQVQDPAVLEKLKVGDKVRFAARSEGGQFTVTELQRAE